MFVDDRPLVKSGLVEIRKNHKKGISTPLGSPKLTDEIIIHALAMLRFYYDKIHRSIDLSELISARPWHYLCHSSEQFRTQLRPISQQHWKNHLGFNEAVNIDPTTFGDKCNPGKTLLKLLQKGEDT